MDFLLTLQNVSVLFLLIVVGYIVGKVGIITEKGQRELSDLVLKVTMPATIILALQLEYTQERFNTALRIMAIVAVSYIVMIILSKLIARIYNVNEGQRDIIEVGSLLPNTSFMGYPIVLSILGGEALFFAVLGSGLIFEVVAWTYGVFTISKNADQDVETNLVKDILLSPGILAIIIGFILFMFSITIPEPLSSTMGLLSQATSPLAMVVVGILLSRSNIKECVTSIRLYIIALVRLLIFPLLIFFVLSLLGFSGMEIVIPVIMLGMPTAAYVAMFAANVDNDANLASQIVFVSSLLSLITIPILVMLVS
ncbi:MAG TPA: AEC family transporter [Tissierellaceae bacterium]|nr:AEC family transporter [Tissierellaceae bacterium]